MTEDSARLFHLLRVAYQAGYDAALAGQPRSFSRWIEVAEASAGEGRSLNSDDDRPPVLKVQGS